MGSLPHVSKRSVASVASAASLELHHETVCQIETRLFDGSYYHCVRKGLNYHSHQRVPSAVLRYDIERWMHSYASTVRYRNEVRQMAHVDGNDNSDLSGHNGSTNRRTIAFQFDTRSHDAVPKMPRWPRSASKREGDFLSRDIIYNRNDIRALLRRTTAAIGPFFRFLLGRIL